MIPKIIHQIWVGDFKIPLREQNLSQKIKDLHPDYEYILWREPDTLPSNVQEVYDRFYKNKNYVFCADLLRMYVVFKYGGFYLDIDFEIKKRLDPIFETDGILFHHDDLDHTIPNNIFGAKKNAQYLQYCIEQVHDGYHWYGPSWFGKNIKEFLKLPYEVPHKTTKEKLLEQGVTFEMYHEFQTNYALHLSLYSWEPKTWERLSSGEQL